jgi:hypothetical protein
LGEVSYRGMLLCGLHTALLRLEDRQEALHYGAFRMDQWMEENKSAAADEKFVERIRHQREEVVAALQLTRLQLRSARKVLSIGS